ncbi:hypothetical protein AAVH_28242 [Aphelenchoides avenae]|nr:hypothetical protein AAVH_28242 [Aphelenchus avenae]
MCMLPQGEKVKATAKRSGRSLPPRQYVCDECDYETVRKSAFERHLELEHCETPRMQETAVYESPSPRHRESMKQRIEHFFAKKRASAGADTHACKPIVQVVDEEDQLNRSFIEQALHDALLRHVWRLPECFVELNL